MASAGELDYGEARLSRPVFCFEDAELRSPEWIVLVRPPVRWWHRLKCALGMHEWLSFVSYWSADWSVEVPVRDCHLCSALHPEDLKKLQHARRLALGKKSGSYREAAPLPDRAGVDTGNELASK